ncbi:MAG TPA: hypothetical protein VGN17_00415 [Bryobacteraceae bacterium]|jgi:hypothetical protein
MKITRARFTLSPFTSETMANIGKVLAKSMRDRIGSGLNALDRNAKPLKPGRTGRNGQELRGYPDYKQYRGLQPIRDWLYSGRTLRSLQVLSVNQNRGTIGFTDAKADQIAHFNNLIEKAFAVSPKDAIALQQAVYSTFKQERLVQFRRVA